MQAETLEVVAGADEAGAEVLTAAGVVIEAVVAAPAVVGLAKAEVTAGADEAPAGLDATAELDPAEDVATETGADVAATPPAPDHRVGPGTVY